MGQPKTYFIEFVPKCPPYNIQDEWCVYFKIDCGGIPGIRVITKFDTKEKAKEYVKKLEKERRKSNV